MNKFVHNESSGTMVRNDLPQKVVEANTQIAELVTFIDTLRQNKAATFSYRELFFKRLKTYI